MSLRGSLEQFVLLCVTVSNFLFYESIYEQIDGVAMYFPLDLSLVNVFTKYRQQIWLRDCYEEFRLAHYDRFGIFSLFFNFFIHSFIFLLPSQHLNVATTLFQC